MALEIALQLYSIRDELAEDFEGTLQRVSEIGYRFVEFAGLYDRDPQQVRQICSGLGLNIVSSHVGYGSLRDNVHSVIEQAEALGNKFAVCPGLPESLRNLEGFGQAAEVLSIAGSELAKHDLGLCYHNHAFEFERLDNGLRGFDIIFQQTKAHWVKAELDVYWVQWAGEDPLDFMRRFSERVPLLHVKDMASGEAKKFAEIGTGVMDIESIVEHAPACGVEYLIIEQDQDWRVSPIDSARTSFRSLDQMVQEV